MRKNPVLLLLLLTLLALALGAVLAGGRRPSTKYQLEMEALQLETASRMQAVKVGFWGGLAAIALLGLAGIIAGLVRAVWRRSQLIHPHTNGLFPVVQGRAGRQTFFHDPNRQLAGSVAYGADREGAVARHLTPPNDQGEQLQVTTQAQAAQLVAAAGQGGGLTAQSRQLAERVALAAASRPIPHLPEIVVPDSAIPEERHLLTALRQDWEDE
jgi:predicted lipid-binding transport protein (Tim44 family)